MKFPGTLTSSTPNLLQGFPTFSQSHKFGRSSFNFKITNSWNPRGKVAKYSPCLTVREKWKEFQGIKNWEGLLDPLDDGLRSEILRYGEFVEAAYHCFDFDTSSPGYATCRFPNSSMLAECGLPCYKVTRHLHATCGAKLPDWARRAPSWVSARSSWIGYTAVCDDEEEIARLGRRDVVIAFRGTATCMEWAENLRAMLMCLPDSMAGGDHEDRCMVQSGFLSLYTSSMSGYPSLQDSVREEVRRILQEYGDEPLSITVTGHSLGAALATLTAYDITTSFREVAPLVSVFSFGGPRVGNRSFRCQLDETGTKVLRIVNSEDPITKVPGFVLEEAGGHGHSHGRVATNNWVQGLWGWVRRRVRDTQWVYAEIGEELKLSSRGCPDLTNGGVATCHDLKTYLHLVDNFVSSNCPIKMTAKRVLNRANQEKQELFI